MPQGFKMKATETESQNSATTEKNEAVSTLNNEVSYKCTPWVVDTSLFTVPADITFTDFTETMKNLNTGDACSTCDYIPDADGKAECRTQLGCE